MTRLLLCGLILATATACSHQDPTPDSALEGQWDYQSTTLQQRDAADQLLVSTPDTTPGLERLVITGTTLQYVNRAAVPTSALMPYTRLGNQLNIDLMPPTIITDLSAHTLTLEYYAYTGTNGTRFYTLEHFTR